MFECLHHYDNGHLRVYYDFADILKNDTKAKVIRLLEWLTNEEGKRWEHEAFLAQEAGEPFEEEPELWVTVSHRWFLAYIWPPIHEDTLRKHLNELEEKDYFATRPHPDKKRRHLAPQYCLNCPKLQQEMQERDARIKRETKKNKKRALSPTVDSDPRYDEGQDMQTENVKGVGTLNPLRKRQGAR